MKRGGRESGTDAGEPSEAVIPAEAAAARTPSAEAVHRKHEPDPKGMFCRSHRLPFAVCLTNDIRALEAELAREKKANDENVKQILLLAKKPNIERYIESNREWAVAYVKERTRAEKAEASKEANHNAWTIAENKVVRLLAEVERLKAELLLAHGISPDEGPDERTEDD